MRKITLLVLLSILTTFSLFATNPLPPELAKVVPETTRVFYGYYKETIDTIDQDPTQGTMIMTIPKDRGNFTAYFQFSYAGCDGEVDTGKVIGHVDSGTVLGDWKGQVDKVDVGGKYYGKFKENGKKISGTYYLSDRLDKAIEFDEDCEYTVSGKGDWQVSEDGIEKHSIEIIKFGAAYKLKWNTFHSHYSLWIYDDECIRQGKMITDCVMWGRENHTKPLFEYGVDGIDNFKPLEIGKKYIVAAYSNTNTPIRTQFLSRPFVHTEKSFYTPER